MSQQRDAKHLFFLGIDGGGTKTLAIVVDALGNERGRGLAGSANHHHATIGVTVAVANACAAAQAALDSASLVAPVTAARIGVAGIDRTEDRDLFASQLAPVAAHTHVSNDGELALSALPDDVGVALIAGTGAIALGRSASGAISRANGWGHIAGDEGSGYTLARLGLQAAARAADGRGPMTLLLNRIMEHWRLTTPIDLMQAIYADDDKARLARLAPLILATAAAGDSVAQRIVQRAASELALSVETVARALCFDQELPLALGGGLLIHETYYRTLIIAQLRTRYPTIAPTLVPEPALSAARAAARQYLVEKGK